MILINANFINLIPPLNREEFEQLEKNILADGIRDPLVLWGEFIIDGYNRYEIALKHGLKFKTIEKEFQNEDEAKTWIILNQFGRRNINAYQRSKLALQLKDIYAEQARQRKVSAGGDKKSENHKSDVQISAQAILDKGKTRDKIAKIAGVSHDTIDKVEDILKKAPEEVIEKLETGEISVNEAHRSISNPRIIYNSGNNEWYTPKEIIILVKKCLGEIDLDPSSSDLANTVINAKQYYTINDDGLSKPWFGKIYLNPPYSVDLINKFIDKFLSHFPNEIQEAIILVNNCTDTKWFQLLSGVANSICFPIGRIKYWSKEKESHALQGQSIFYFGNDYNKFSNIFSSLGCCWYR